MLQHATKNSLLQYYNKAVVAHFAKNHEDLSSSEIDLIFAETMKVLYIASLSEKPLAPKPLVEEMWATFVIFSEDYRSFCQTHFDAFIEYIPKQKPVTGDMITYTEALLRQHFPPQVIDDAPVLLKTLYEEVDDLKGKFDGILFIMLSSIFVSIIAVIFAATIPLEKIETFFFGEREICAVNIFTADSLSFKSKTTKWTDIKAIDSERSMQYYVAMSLSKDVYKKEKEISEKYYLNLNIANVGFDNGFSSLRFANGNGWSMSISSFNHTRTDINFAIDLSSTLVKTFIEKKPKYIVIVDNNKQEFKIDIPQELLKEMLKAFECTYLLQFSDEKINKL